MARPSDWAIEVAARDYAELRCAGHINAFQQLAAMAEKVAGGDFLSEGERRFLEATAERDRPFADLDWRLWAGVESPA